MITQLRCNILTILAVIPAFLLGAVAPQIGKDLPLELSDVGMAVAVMFTVSAVTARFLGSVTQAMGFNRGMALSGGLSASALLLCGLAQSVSWMFLAFVVAGLANATAHPAVNAAIAASTHDSRHGLAFGIKQSSVPAATLLCGVAVPGIALVVGWRWAFWLFAAAALCLAVGSVMVRSDGEPALRASPESHAGTPDTQLTGRQMNLLAVIAGTGMAAATSLGVFLVASGVDAGLEAGTAALIGTLCSSICIAMRIALGWLADRRTIRDGYVLIAVLLAAGATGHLLLGVANGSAFLVGALVAYGLGWSWTGLLQACVVRDNRAQVATATGRLTVGTSLGAAAGPLVFGLVVDSFGFAPAWVMAGALSLGAGLFMAGWRLVNRRVVVLV